MMAKCISLSNYNLSSTNVLIIGAGNEWHILGQQCVSPPSVGVRTAGCSDWFKQYVSYNQTWNSKLK